MRSDLLFEDQMAKGKLDEAAIFEHACQMETPEARLSYIEQACAGNRVLLARVQALLCVYERNPNFLESPAEELQGVGQAVVSEGVGSVIGPYKLVEQIGEGGFGVVFMTEQRQPVRRTVALKILKPGMDTRQVVARFEAERQALALMDHPNIAHVLDGGQTPTGRPYFVMDLVKGVPITGYCDEHQLTPRERLALFIPICRAIQHAHQKGIIHRDLKPTNVLIAAYDGQPVPKVIDFGVAKAMGQPLTDRTLVTGFGGIVGTLEYMSPEQAEFNARDVDTRADIYSLGVLLYELLTGTTPLTKQRLKESATPEVLRLIREDEPPKPSTRLSELSRARTPRGAGPVNEQSNPALGSYPSMASISAQRRLEPARLTRELRGELDWIVMKALEKDRSRRYDTANGLARDIERYLNGEVVEACPPSAGYKLRKFARKNGKLLGVATAFVMLLTAGAVVSLWQAIRATHAEYATGTERDRAEGEATRAGLHLYAAHMSMAQNAWEGARISRVIELLELYRPKPGDRDLRGFEWHYLRRLTDTALNTWRGHNEEVLYVVFSPDGKWLTSSSHDRTIKLWEVATGRQPLTLNGHTDRIPRLAFSPDGKRLASASTDGTVRLWDLDSGREAGVFKRHSGRVIGVAFSPDGKWLASGGHDDLKVRVWDAATFQERWVLEGHSGPISGMAFSTDGLRLASSSNDRTLKLWDLLTGRLIRTFQGHTDEVHNVAFSPDGKRLASAGRDWTVRVWDVDNGHEQLKLKGHTDRVFGVVFSPDGQRLASASMDQTVKVWDAISGDEALTLRGHTSWVNSVAFSPDGKRLASAGEDRTIKLWDVATQGEPMMVIQENNLLKSVAFSPDGKRLASACVNRTVKVWDADSGRETLILNGHDDQVFSVAFGPQRQGKVLLASAGQDRMVKVWNLPMGSETGALATGGRNLQPLTLRGHTGAINCVVFSPDGNRLASASEDQTVRVWDLDTNSEPGATAEHNTPTFLLTGHTGAVTSVAFSLDGKQLASAGKDQTIRMWDAVDGRFMFALDGHARQVNSVAFSPDGDRLASAGGDMTVKIWDVTSRQAIMNLTGHTYSVNSVVFSPDGKRLATASADKTVKVWDIASGQETLSLKGHTNGIPSLAFSPDGMRLASAGYDWTIRVWDARPWTPQLRIQQEARNLIGQIHANYGLKAEVIHQIERDSALSPEVRLEALEMANRWQEDPDWLNLMSWKVVAYPGAALERYAFALRQAEAACRLEPENGNFINTLGAALYRNHRFQESLETLTHSDKIQSALTPGRHPDDVTFLAMSQFKLGRHEEARALLAELRRLVTLPQWSSNAEKKALLREASALIEGKQ